MLFLFDSSVQFSNMSFINDNVMFNVKRLDMSVRIGQDLFLFIFFPSSLVTCFCSLVST